MTAKIERAMEQVTTPAMRSRMVLKSGRHVVGRVSRAIGYCTCQPGDAIRRV